jgi:hypothetical protein
MKPCTICGIDVPDGSNFFCRNETDGERTHARCYYLAEGYAQGLADVVALLRTKRTAGGETIVNAAHAADVIERGDAKGAAERAAEQGKG